MKIKEELVNSILRQYDTYMESEIPSHIKLDEEQNAFVQGYLCGTAQQGATQRTDDSLIRDQIIQTRSKYCEPVLELLANEGELYHGDLAEKMNLSPSGLNAIIKKMQETEIPIINTTQIGKYKIYSLPDDVREYMLRKGRVQEQAEEDDVQRNAEGMNRPDMILCLQHFVDVAGRKWKDDLSRLFRGIERDISAEVRAEFENFADALNFAYIEDTEEMADLKRLFNHNDVLLDAMDGYMKNYDLRKELKKRKDDGRLTSSDKRIIGNML